MRDQGGTVSLEPHPPAHVPLSANVTNRTENDNIRAGIPVLVHDASEKSSFGKSWRSAT